MPVSIGGLRTVVYMVPDLNAAKEWYSKTFGIKPYFDTEFYVGFNVGGYELGLHPQNSDAEKTDNVYAYWAVEDVPKVYDTLLEEGGTVLEKPADVGDGIVLAAVKDPWGNVFGIIDNPHFKLQ